MSEVLNQPGYSEQATAIEQNAESQTEVLVGIDDESNDSDDASEVSSLEDFSTEEPTQKTPLSENAISSQFHEENGKWMATLTTAEGDEIQVELFDHKDHNLETRDKVLALKIGDPPITQESAGTNQEGEEVTFRTIYERTEEGFTVIYDEIASALPKESLNNTDDDGPLEDVPERQLTAPSYPHVPSENINQPPAIRPSTQQPKAYSWFNPTPPKQAKKPAVRSFKPNQEVSTTAADQPIEQTLSGELMNPIFSDTKTVDNAQSTKAVHKTPPSETTTPKSANEPTPTSSNTETHWQSQRTENKPTHNSEPSQKPRETRPNDEPDPTPSGNQKPEALIYAITKHDGSKFTFRHNELKHEEPAHHSVSKRSATSTDRTESPHSRAQETVTRAITLETHRANSTRSESTPTTHTIQEGQSVSLRQEAPRSTEDDAVESPAIIHETAPIVIEQAKTESPNSARVETIAHAESAIANEAPATNAEQAQKTDVQASLAKEPDQMTKQPSRETIDTSAQTAAQEKVPTKAAKADLAAVAGSEQPAAAPHDSITSTNHEVAVRTARESAQTAPERVVSTKAQPETTAATNKIAKPETTTITTTRESTKPEAAASPIDTWRESFMVAAVPAASTETSRASVLNVTSPSFAIDGQPHTETTIFAPNQSEAHPADFAPAAASHAATTPTTQIEDDDLEITFTLDTTPSRRRTTPARQTARTTV